MNESVADLGHADAPVLQGLWESVRAGQQQILLSPYLAASFAFLTHLALCAPFLVLDALGGVCQRVRSWRMAAGSGPPPSLWKWYECFWRVLFKYITAVLPATALFQLLRSSSLPELAPSCWQLSVEVVACFLLFDTLFFIWHYCMHRVPWLYRAVHQMHHQHHVPFALAAQDASSAELLSLLLLALGSAWMLGCHPLSEALFHFLNSWLAVEDHCGYNLPWALHRILPCMGGAPFHQTHHKKQSKNFAPYFTHWDHLFGTYIEPRSYFRKRHDRTVMK
ncbi:PREDICTED: cholesterol 25-hydroxylase-like protein [Poecilia mexicana]|uniref:Cholesterol 25-hydroxylase-like protein n=1 Tax=Poecilia formosa TaxID=48698 RepID=A0A087XDJ6_POEFO|nr:PREDICTED: cholesterol 25-hydroxylase-like protein [Poecilia formosa]XP_014858514.1 PREDICTED: cholesterol 25-hydroxylase-like protein [Poecilia mexicana]